MAKLRSFFAARSATQAGFALLVVLGVIGLLSLTVVALLSQTIVAGNVSLAQRAEARSNRSAESAVDTAVNIVRTQSSGQIAGADDPCAPLRVEAGNTKLAIPDLDGQTVDIYCSSATPPGDYSELLSTAPAAGRTRLVGSSADSRGYPTRSAPGNRLLAWDLNCATPTPTNSAAAPTDATCVPWRAALGSVWEGYASPVNSANQTFLDNINPNLVHSGPGTLNFGGDLEVRSGAAVALNPANKSGPAVNVSGQYRQGANGPQTFLTGYSGAGSCSILSPTWGTISGAPSWIAGVIPDVAINDGDAVPECNNADAAKLRDQPGAGVIDASLAAPAVWSTSSFEPAKFRDTVPACTDTMYLTAGVYPAATMTALNNRIASCNAGNPTTYVFAAGDYWFDTDLVIGNQNANVVFGAVSGNVPKACNPAEDGVTITLRDRATIRHTDGRLSICNRTTGSTTALYQAPQTPAEWSPTTASVASAQNSGTWTTAPSTTNLSTADGTNALWGRTCSGTFVVNCNGNASATVTMPGAATTPTAVLPALSVRVVADSTDLRTGYDVLGRFNASLANEAPNVQITATKAGGASCTRYFLGVPNWKGGTDVPLAYDLLLPGPNGQDLSNANDCRNKFRTQADLQGATVKVDFVFRSYFVELNPANWFTAARSYNLTVDQIKVEAPWAADGRTSSNGAAGALAASGASVSYTTECTFFGCSGTPEVVPEVSNFSASAAGYLPGGGRPDTVGVEVTGSNRYADGTDSKTRVVLKDRNGSTLCQTEVSHPPYFGQTMYLQLLGPGNTGPCANQIGDVLDLTRATVVTTVTGKCKSPEFGKFCRSGFLGVGYINVDVDHVRLVATTTQDTSRRSAIRVTSDARTSSPASFYVDGDVSVPRRDLEINWRGPASTEPLVQGELVLNGLASAATTAQAEVGTICCGPVIPKDRYVTLYAMINGNLKAAVEVTVSDTVTTSGTETYSPGSDVFVRSWGLCDAVPASTSLDDLAATAESCTVP